MKLKEFLAFIEGMDVIDAPTPEQWAKITKKLELITPEVVTVALAQPQVIPAYNPYQNTQYNPNQYATVTSSGLGSQNALGGLGNALPPSMLGPK